MTEQKKTPGKKHRRLLWFFVFLILVFLTFRAILSGSDSFSSDSFLNMLKTASPLYLLAAVGCMLGFILTEAISLRMLAGFFGHRRPLRKNVVYSAADIYFSAITPSATGGQPASAVFMIRDGIPPAITTMCLLLNVLLYTVSLLIVGLVCFLLRPGLFFEFRLSSRVLIVVGMGIQSLFVVGLSLLVLKERIVLKIATWGLNLLHKLHLVKQVDQKRESLHRMAEEYRTCIDSFRNGKGVLCKALLLNLAQRLCNIGVTAFVFLATGGSLASVPTVLIIQGYVLVGANAVPVPGAVGITDFLFLDGFRFLKPLTTCIELLCRGISFYICLILSGLIVLVAFLRHTKQTCKHHKTDA